MARWRDLATTIAGSSIAGGEYVDQSSDYKLLKKFSVPWSKLISYSRSDVIKQSDFSFMKTRVSAYIDLT
jgi:hypothetical protein